MLLRKNTNIEYTIDQKWERIVRAVMKKIREEERQNNLWDFGIDVK